MGANRINLRKKTSMCTKTVRYARQMTAMLIVAVLISISSMNRVEAAAGDLDPTFGVGGTIPMDFFVHAVAVQADGKIVAAGVDFLASGDYVFGLARYNKNGSLDSSFGAGGKVTTDEGFDSSIMAVAIQADGKIIAGGSTKYSDPSNDKDFALARYNIDGSLDTSFGGNGITTTGVGVYDEIEDIAIQSNGKIVAVGSIDDGFHVLRYNTNGTLDSSFGSGGVVTTNVYSVTDTARAVAIQADGKIVVAGHSTHQGILVRYNSNGSLDASFGFGGLVALDFPNSGEAFIDVALQADGRIVGIGEITYGGSSTDNFFVACYKPDGSPDSTFGYEGITSVNFGPDDFAGRVVLQDDGKIIVAGTTGTSYNLAIARLTSEGHLDTSFGSGGKVTTDNPGGDPGAPTMNGIAIYGGEQIIAGGYGFNLARYQGDATPASANLDVTMSASPTGNTIAYTITVNNYGPDPSYYVTLKDTLPVNTTFVSFTAPQGWVVYSRPGLGQTGTVSVSRTKMVDSPLKFTSSSTFTLVVRLTGAAAGTTIGNRATVSSFTADPFASNDRAIVYVSVP